ncbi:hypothetical protein [Plebeiibacterium sediminum]|uniref:Uncharacterized protein n=1 Tax=Plebeiibacterium sediminum TaxID=2992112 RepID=A0AAE3M6P3_9BACT|nr:hypothetical protein [Plebeiobacterium sediminum]MCW3787917.1 hypothetical protein [Plebeiobacterium sediminum]
MKNLLMLLCLIVFVSTAKAQEGTSSSQQGTDSNDWIIKSGFSGFMTQPASILLDGKVGDGSDIIIDAGTGSGYGGKINITAGNSLTYAGDIQIAAGRGPVGGNIDIIGGSTSAPSGGNINFYRLSSSNKILSMFIKGSNGYVGIGYSNPSYKLDVDGTTRTNSLITENIKILKNGTTSKILFSAQTNDPGEIRHIENNNSAQLWIDPSDDFDAGATNDFFIVGEPDTNTQRFWVRGDGATYINKSLGIGKTPTSDAKLDVAGTIRAEEILVEANGNTADFVFADDYSLKDLAEVENYIKSHKHLPDIPSAEEMEASSVNLAEMNKLLLQKVEELTLYTIELEKKDKNRGETIITLSERLEKIERLITSDK